MKKCNLCGRVYRDNETFCVDCRTVLSDANSNITPMYGNANNFSVPITKKHSVLSIVAFILSFLCWISFVGVILGIIDLAKNNPTKKHGLSIAAIVIGVIFTLGFVCIMSFSDTTSNPSPTTSVIQETEVEDSTSTEMPIITTETISDKAIPEIEPSEIYNGNDVSISIDKMEVTDSKTTIDFVLSSNSTKDYSMSAHTFSINGLMAGGTTYGSDVDLPAGKKAKLSISIDNQWLKDNGISDIGSINIIFWAYYDMFKEWNTENIDIKTSLYEESPIYTIADDAIYSDDYISVWYVGNTGNEYTFKIQNKSSYNANYTIENCSVNDWSYDLGSSMYDLYEKPIHTNSYDSFTIVVDDDFLSESNISNIESLEFNVKVSDSYWDYTGALWEISSEKVKLTF